MILHRINLINFKNYENVKVDFCTGLNCLTGLNGSGKTNLLDALYYLSLTKSAFNSIDSQNIRHNSDFFSIKADFSLKNKDHQLQCSLKQGEKKSFKVDGSTYDKLSEHIGKFPVVLIAPNDDDLIRESSEVRRKFFDSIISQTNKNYLTGLIRYNHVLKQRNSLLKRIFETGRRDKDLIGQYDKQIIDLSVQLSGIRANFIKDLLPGFVSHYQTLSGGKEQVDIQYGSKALDEDFPKNFTKAIEKDIVLQRTTMGIHRDDYAFLISDNPLKKYGSQGQQKSFLISLKLAQFEFIKANNGLTPILLLDDIFDKLDDERIQKLLDMIGQQKFKQIFLTDARKERTRELLTDVNAEIKVFEIESNEINCL